MLTLILGISTVFLCIMVITNSALSSRKLVRVVARHHELTTEYDNKIKELESSPLFDCEKGKHYWGLWEDVSAEPERVVQKRRCGECNKLEFSGVDSPRAKEISPAIEPKSNTFSTRIGTVVVDPKDGERVTMDCDGYLIIGTGDGETYQLRAVRNSGANVWRRLSDGADIIVSPSGEYILQEDACLDQREVGLR